MTGNDITVNTAAFLGKPLNEACAISDFAARFCKRLAHFSCQNLRQILCVVQHQLLPCEQDGTAFFRCLGSPFLLCLIGSINRNAHFISAQVCDPGQFFAGGRIDHRIGA